MRNTESCSSHLSIQGDTYRNHEEAQSMVKNGKATQKTTPIPSNPELVVVSERVGNGEWINEYRVYNFRSLPSSRIRKDDSVGLLGWVVVGIILWMVKDLQWHDIISGKGTLLEVILNPCVDVPSDSRYLARPGILPCYISSVYPSSWSYGRESKRIVSRAPLTRGKANLILQNPSRR